MERSHVGLLLLHLLQLADIHAVLLGGSEVLWLGCFPRVIGISYNIWQ
jgi:hypothetical protein